MRAWQLGIGWLLVATSACSQDFSAFQFGEDAPPRTTMRAESSQAAAGVAPSEEPGPEPEHASQASARAQMVPPSAAGSAAADGGRAGSAAPSPDAPAEPVNPLDETAQRCATSWRTLQAGSDACAECACGACVGEVDACLSRGGDHERELCRAVLECALANRCQDYDCYCASSECGYPDGSGDGPCAEVMDAAAGGNRSRVLALRGADPLDDNQPLVRGVQAVGCIYGLNEASPEGPTAGECSDICQ